VARSKATAFALRRATVVDTAGAAVDLSAVIGSIEDEKAEEAAAADAAEEAAEAAAEAAAEVEETEAK